MDLTTITATVRLPGLHHWPTAPDQRAYLRSPHRHLFVARAVVAVVHDDREVEFHDLGDDLEVALAAQRDRTAYGAGDESLLDFGARSCEVLARAAAAALRDRGYPVVEVSVSEDDEFTATVYPGTDPDVPAARPIEAHRIPDPDRTPGQEPLA